MSVLERLAGAGVEHDWRLGIKFGVVGLVCARCGRIRYPGQPQPDDHSCPMTLNEKDNRIRRLVAALEAPAGAGAS